MKLNYALQRSIEEAIVETLRIIGQKCRVRIEIDDGDGQVIESRSGEEGKWEHTNWHHKSGDEAFSIFPEFSVDLPLLKSIKEAMPK